VAFWHSQTLDRVASATAVSVYEPLIGTYVHVLLSLTGKCMVNGYVPSARRDAFMDNRTAADSSVSSEPSTLTLKTELAIEIEQLKFCVSSQIVLQTPGNSQGVAGPHLTDGLVRSPFSAHNPPIPESPAMLNATTVVVASVMTELAVFLASNLTAALVKVLKNGACHRQCSTAADTIKGAHALTPAATQLPRARVSCPSRSVEAGHLCGKKTRPATPRADTRALGTGSSNMLRAISLQRTAQCRGLARAEERNERKAAQRSGAAYSRFKRVKPVKLSGSVPFKRLSLRSLWWHPTQRNQKHTSRGERVSRLGFEHTHACTCGYVRA
jgi:hypothetical protein